ncbi:MAG: hypothetical protein ACQEXJ_15320 [Myxococcota bacterium]
MKSQAEHGAVVLGAFETGLAVARALGRAGIRVDVLDVRDQPGLHSRYARPVSCPDPRSDEAAFLACLERLAPDGGPPPVLFVTSDEFLPTISHRRDRLAERFLVNVPDRDVVDAIVDKASQAALAKRVGVPVPATFAVETTRDAARVAYEAPLPAFVKGRDADAWRRLLGAGTKGWEIHDRAELLERLDALLAAGVAPLVQEMIPGPPTEHYKLCAYIGADGAVLATFGLRKIRQHPPGAGFGCAVVSRLDPEVAELGLRLLRGIGYRGVGSAEFKRDLRDGSVRLIELNPRYWQQNGLAARCGVNFPLVQYADLVGRPPEIPRPQLEGVRWINLGRDLDTFRHDHRHGALGLAPWLWSLRPPHMWSLFAWDDPAPSLRALLPGGSFALRVRHLGDRLRRAGGRYRRARRAAP